MAKARRKTLKLDTPAAVRKALARVANMVLNNELDEKRANSITATCNVILSSIRLDEQEKKIIEFQQYLEMQKMREEYER